MRETETIWMNGEFVAWEDATVHVGAHGLHYGSGVFEGIRCYETPKGPGRLPPADHLHRLERSAKLLYMELSVRRRGDADGDARAASAGTGCPSATSARSPSTATASSASARATTRSRS